MSAIRKGLAAVLIVVGGYYCVVAGSVLVRVPTVTAQWIQRSGDADFKLDSAVFAWWIGGGAALVGVLGGLTVLNGLMTLRGRGAPWLGLALAALPLHWFWLLYRSIGSTVFGPEVRSAVQWHSALQFGIVCVGYFLMWLIVRPRAARSAC